MNLDEELQESLLAVWLKYLGREAVFNKAVRAIMVTPGGEMMMDKTCAFVRDG